MSDEPEAYQTKNQSFCGLEFFVDKRVLIPRLETEQMTKEAIGLVMTNDKIQMTNIADIGTGSGCIAITLAKNLPNAKITAIDISPDALEVAKQNAKTHGVEDQIEFLQGDFFEPLAGKKFDLIISNPPYIPSNDIDTLMESVRDFEPHRALDGGADGLDYIRKLIQDGPRYLAPNGILMFEMEYRHGPAVKKLCPGARIVKDYQGIDRIGILKFKS
ncbi:protein-(glutamine-N5) methyltransferase, release factor-specific [candidate division WOR-1 bacterium RIFOXYA12_FULL_43_27]|uniref:Protein-(Glutamine-N5) methyltransferase, release factor-specific n=1 Tax=candidate division WOR-1 bacterium RIFOXYC2_FULL_46_14 TaxID=1802587 RepID=A0A1F4U3P1_UNCSA|nr:MAG: protein-(glutamine-N5) methyltransferase, release factor-specific [candidate division WOR-1 bacterium RIFOXYA12_FULL_43_27]OGC20163.1 MAG: protein-(glutamine-N5) methyltransferase, release factor-specific [candidate division WOR-1 bacterium RIFOXYB2_FULL_46_45]OGC32100.1 MAG: protein-(glutamine-N5) methyltransferase, release factor-specific [candidate division WOR-1 bacterium RIFOXYA2_FULL_46_56]OGC39501.1 MAG: protein-(glutamine-N5) methyltransferase, release factor-specific [candidate 